MKSLDKVLIPLGMLLVAAVGLLFGQGILNGCGKDDDPVGTITFPRDGAHVNPTLMTEGMLANIPDEDRVWLAVRVGNRFYPKPPEINPNETHWSREFVEAGQLPEERFSLVLLRVSSEGQDQLEDWLASGASTGSFEGLPQISGSTELDSATGLVLGQPVE
ncbi:MAG TPA: hypothetical protein VF176_02300 [Solirubrobacterales bacterium]